jgi:hypothetical protein
MRAVLWRLARAAVGVYVLAASLLRMAGLAGGYSWAVHSMTSRRAGAVGLIFCPLAQPPIARLSYHDHESSTLKRHRKQRIEERRLATGA